MKTFQLKKIALLLCLLLPLAVVACDDEEEPGGTDTMSDTSTGGDTAETDTTEADTAEADTTEADTAETDTTETDTTTGDTEDDTMTAMGACTNASDLAIVQGDPDPADVAATCGQGCVSDADPKTCTVTCMKMPANVPDLSDECAGCYADSVVCTIDNCLGQCIADSSSPGCIDCREMMGCTPEFYECSGLPRN